MTTYRPNTPRFECPDCGIVVAIKYPQGAYCVDCERKLQEKHGWKDNE